MYAGLDFHVDALEASGRILFVKANQLYNRALFFIDAGDVLLLAYRKNIRTSPLHTQQHKKPQLISIAGRKILVVIISCTFFCETAASIQNIEIELDEVKTLFRKVKNLTGKEKR